jgi:glycosyltransferase involved in cell wall biosynthesis
LIPARSRNDHFNSRLAFRARFASNFLALKILHINSARAMGGGERHLTDLVTQLAARGHELFLAHAPAAPLEKNLSSDARIKLFPVRMRNALDLTSATKIARLIRQHRIEIVHAHLARDYTIAALAVGLANRNLDDRQTKLIFTRHVLFPLKKFQRLTFARAARVIAVSNGVAHQLVARRLVSSDKVRVIHHGIAAEQFDLGEDFDRADYRHKLLKSSAVKDKFIIGAIGELSFNKGHDLFIRAAKIVRERFGARAHFVIAGEDASSQQTTRQSLERLIAKLNLNSSVHLLGRIEDVAPFLKALDVFVSASRAEAFGLAIVEAMASGAPVIATATDGARAILEDEKTGVIVPVDNAEALARAVINLLEDANRRAQIAKEARASARARFSLARMIDETEAVYREAAKEN